MSCVFLFMYYMFLVVEMLVVCSVEESIVVVDEDNQGEIYEVEVFKL